MSQRTSRAYTYTVTVPPEELPVTLDIFKAHLKKSLTPSSEDPILTLYLGSAVSYAEEFTRRDFIRRTYRTYRDFFPSPYQNEGYYEFGFIPSRTDGISSGGSNVGFEIRRSPLVSVEQVAFTSTDGTQDNIVDPLTYYATSESDYSEILAQVDQVWPTTAQKELQSVYIDFICGLSENSTAFMMLYPDLTLAILNHATYMWANRGDCGSGCGTPGASLPGVSRSTYLQNRIENL